jgi:hypothetical protein
MDTKLLLLILRKLLKVVGSGLIRLTGILNPRTAHVLKNDLAIDIGVISAATMLHGPFDLK